ncbi:hypothetical protein [Halarcobacter anaerophilus]|uniref:Uncharacterized protein n=1 Tax=Halarcobacter anaerophilus TaxID=877500 RepID=A0A4Q0XZ46_9BACT|nr:hypothetical protein [Halarcobacter anaerophilus]QDF28268.1 hypothetical protein AANAER_0774 [Halarcobacter anaerophilus]RXJ62064.1 hypothetical protein CRV06_11575 [Halarcobacter anaerophilus]
MRVLFIVALLILSLEARNYTYLIDEYDKVIDLEAKIISKIAKDIVKDKKVKLYIPHLKRLDEKVYSSKVDLVHNCEEANFIFIKYKVNLKKCEGEKNKIFFTNNYKKLLKNRKFLGAFFWSKSRPNIVLIKKRLNKKRIKLPKEYNQFIEDYDEK